MRAIPSTKTWQATLTRAATAGDTAEITITTPATDLMGDTIDPLGMNYQRYLRGPAAVNVNHRMHESLPVAKTLAIEASPRGLRAQFRWLMGNPATEAVRSVFEADALAASVEIQVAEAYANSSKGYDITKSILTGWAFTGSPANPECVRMFKSLGWASSWADHMPVVSHAGYDDDVIYTFNPSEILREERRARGRDNDMLEFDVAEFRQAGREFLAEQIPGMVDRSFARHVPAEDAVVVDVDEFKAALREFIGPMIRESVGRNFRKLTGRLD